MTTTLEQAVSQIQQELLTVRAQVASRVRMSESVQATDNLTTAQSYEDVHSKASSCINTNDVGRPKEFSGKEEDLQHWSDDIKAFFAGVLKRKSRRQRSISSSCRRSRTEVEECATWSSSCSICMRCSGVARLKKQTTLLPTRRRTHWRRGDGYMNDSTLLLEEGKGTSFAPSFLRDVALSRNSKRELNAGSPM